MYLTFILEAPDRTVRLPGGRTLLIRGLYLRVLLNIIWTVAAVALAVEILFREHVYRIEKTVTDNTTRFPTSSYGLSCCNLCLYFMKNHSFFCVCFLEKTLLSRRTVTGSAVPSAFSRPQFYCAPAHAFSAGGSESDGVRQCCIPYYNGNDDYDYTKPLIAQGNNTSITLLCCAKIEPSSLVFFLIPIVWFCLMSISMILVPNAAKRFSCL
jgi:hypothetical protein